MAELPHPREEHGDPGLVGGLDDLGVPDRSPGLDDGGDSCRPGGFDGPVTIRTDAAYLEIFDENGLHPDPASSTRDGAELVWEFDTPPGDTFVLALDARIEPGVQWAREGRTSVDVGAGVGEVTYRTWVLP